MVYTSFKGRGEMNQSIEIMINNIVNILVSNKTSIKNYSNMVSLNNIIRNINV